ncbi:hypothetical protein PoB_001936000 [Plakobranchus ocellatus]|uniref:Uncharacterized protein n=1 Tax=Plakobranchus ocellatus TaxID=259542 RepID=A0AAV3ZBE5_9GAST|nr:hypothetical protein PoB_001936000 [Plakobranchus ocellatus]
MRRILDDQIFQRRTRAPLIINQNVLWLAKGHETYWDFSVRDGANSIPHKSHACDHFVLDRLYTKIIESGYFLGFYSTSFPMPSAGLCTVVSINLWHNI